MVWCRLNLFFNKFLKKRFLLITAASFLKKNLPQIFLLDSNADELFLFYL